MADRKSGYDFVMVSEAYSTDLKGRQSVRTTFKLPPRCIDALSLLAGQLGIKQKSIFDHLVDDMQALQAVAQDLETDRKQTENRVAKTYVISRRTLENLERVSKRYQAPRDALVEFSIERIMPLLREERKKHEQRKRLQGQLNQLLQDSRELLAQADGALERDDPAFERIVLMARAVQAGCEEVREIIEKGRRLEEF